MKCHRKNQRFEAGDFLNIFLRFLGFWGSLSYKNIIIKKVVLAWISLLASCLWNVSQWPWKSVYKIHFYCKFFHHICKKSVGVHHKKSIKRASETRLLCKVEWVTSKYQLSSTSKLCILKLIVFQGSAITKLLAKLTTGERLILLNWSNWTLNSSWIGSLSLSVVPSVQVSSLSWITSFL